jgi:uncharacterized circularly permuted ATP-grasp superfamily protein/uncharacterized alpha-E superfamily protein
MTAFKSDLSIRELIAQQAVIDRLLDAEGAGHVVHDLPVRADGRAVSLESRPWRLDPIPYVIDRETFGYLEAAVTSRMLACDAIIDDLYGQRRLVGDGIVDPALLWATPRYRLAEVDRRQSAKQDPASPGAQGRTATKWLSTYALDLVRDVHGVWHAIADHTDAPTGFGYALLNRAVLANVVHAAGDERPRRIDAHLATLRLALTSTSAVDGPRVVILTAGIDHPSYVEHSYLATKLGFNLVEGADLVVRRRAVWLRTLSGLEPVDVVHRRLEDHCLDPMEVNATGAVGVPGMLLAAQSGSVALANAPGTGVIEAPELLDCWDDAAEMLTGYRPTLALAVATTPGVDADRLIGATAERVPRLQDGVINYDPIVIRLHAVATSDGITVLPCGNGRVLAATDDPRVPTPCVAKDVWVLGVDPTPITVLQPAPQVDLLASVPTRAADSLSWMGRAAERAEVIARAARVVLTGRATGLELPSERLLAALCGSTGEPPDVGRRIADEIGVMLAEAASVREFLSMTAGRVLGSMVEVRQRLQMGVLDVLVLDDLLMHLSAFAGLWNESVVRGPAWFYGDFARRHERAMVVLWSVAAYVPDPPQRMESDVMEMLLATHDSLVAYRRRHRSDLDHDAVLALLIHDELNPRSVRASLDRLQRAAAAIDWTEADGEIAALLEALEGARTADQLVELALALGGISTRLVDARLVTPPDPMVVGTQGAVRSVRHPSMRWPHPTP